KTNPENNIVYDMQPPPENSFNGDFQNENNDTNNSNNGEKKNTTIRTNLTIMPFDCVNGQLVCGKKITQKAIPLSDVTAESGRVIVCGEVFAKNIRYTRDNSKFILSIDITDYTGSNTLKVIDDKRKEHLYEKVNIGSVILARGDSSYDKYDHDIIIRPYDIMTYKKVLQNDDCDKKRVELHLHTIMSAMDGMTKTADAVNTAFRWGHKAMAITDHGVVQSFPDAMNAVDKIRKNGGEFKIVYGVEDYFVDNYLDIVKGDADCKLSGRIIVFDTETTGLDEKSERMTEIGAVCIENGEIISEFDTFVNPQKPISDLITKLTGITDDMVKDAPNEKEALELFFDYCGNLDSTPLVAHNAPFDMKFVNSACKRCNINKKITSLDTVVLSRKLLPNIKNHKLDTVAEHFKLGDFNHHRACDDARMLGMIYLEMKKLLENDYNIQTFQEINTGFIDVKKAPSYHQIILVKNSVGLKNLYKLVSYGHINYFFKKPRTPKSEIIKHREGLLIGSACEAGELYKAILAKKQWKELCKIAEFYDFLEIQPTCNNMFLIRNGT
ncbi:MAG: exonuclease domain-containing protein, partial [Oscillospiraceae bacterium]